MVETIQILSALKIATVAAGLVFLTWAGKAYLKHRTRNMATLVLAVSLLTLAAISEGIAFEFLGFPLDLAHILEAVFTLAGFLVLVASVLVAKLQTAELDPEEADLPREQG